MMKNLKTTKKIIELKLQKDDRLVNTFLLRNTLCRVLNSEKIKKVKDLKVNDVLLNNYVVFNIKKRRLNLDFILNKIKMNNITDQLDEFCNELDKIFKSVYWDFDNPECQNMCKKYNVVFVKKLFTGVQVYNIFGDMYYCSWAAMKQDYYSNILRDIDLSSISEIKLI